MPTAGGEQTGSRTAGRLPTFLIVGAMKSGTTSLAQYLAAHPEVYVPPKKEAHFFERDELWNRGADWYRGWFAGAGDQWAVGEGTASYMFFTEVPARMASVVPRARLIAILRDPVERAYSHYLHARTRGGERRTFREVVDEELRGDRLDRPAVSGSGSRRAYYLARGLYLEQLQRLCEHYDRESLLVLLLEDLELQPARVFAEVCRFLGIDETVAPDNLGSAINPYVKPRSQRLWELTLHLRLWRWLPKAASQRAARALIDFEPGRPAMDPDARARLSAYFAAPNAALGEWLGQDLSVWGGPEAQGQLTG